MLIGKMEELAKLLAEYKDETSEVDAGDVLNCIVESVAAGDCWFVPVGLLEDGENETDIAEGSGLEKLPMFRKTVVTNKKEERFFCAFTSEEAMNADREEGTRISVKYSARACLRDLLSSEEIEGLVINPWTESFSFRKDTAETILDLADSIPEDTAAGYHTYRLSPKVVIDTNEILEAWREGWNDNDGKAEAWELVNYPVMPDGHVLLLFKMEGEIYGGRVPELEVIHKIVYYRVLEISVEDGKPKVLNRYRFNFQDAHVGTVFLHDGVLHAAVSVDGKEKYDILQVDPNDDSRQFTIYRNVETLVADSKGNVAVAYNKNLLDPARYPVMVFDPDGDAITRYHDENSLWCSEVNLDSDENVWFIMYPSGTLDMLNGKTKSVEAHRVALQGFDSFALSTDRSKLYTAYTESGGGSVHYVMTANEDGDYVNPIRFEFRPGDKDGNILEAKDCEIFGRPSVMKSWVILQADGCLYYYDIDDCCEE